MNLKKASRNDFSFFFVKLVASFRKQYTTRYPTTIYIVFEPAPLTPRIEFYVYYYLPSVYTEVVGVKL